jgi:hypothetical protein
VCDILGYDIVITGEDEGRKFLPKVAKPEDDILNVRRHENLISLVPI